jgi:hypothetical protein
MLVAVDIADEAAAAHEHDRVLPGVLALCAPATPVAAGDIRKRQPLGERPRPHLEHR